MSVQGTALGGAALPARGTIDGTARVRRWPLRLCRTTTVALALMGVAQAAVAGSYLSGHYDALRVHLVLGMVMVGVAVVQAVGVVFLRRAGAGRPVLVAGLLLPVMLAGQGALGMSRVVGLHTPLGVLVVVGIVQLTAAVWRTRPAGAQR